jgi:catechol 2,3-dioxygenase-like lactoylglutathione lyase family enzyme
MSQLKAVHPVLMVRDVSASIRFYAQIGFRAAFADDKGSPQYAGVRRDSVELHLQWHDAKEWSGPSDRPTYRFLVTDVDELHAEFAKNNLLSGITDVGNTAWGTREFHLRDPDGNGLQFYRDRNSD